MSYGFICHRVIVLCLTKGDLNEKFSEVISLPASFFLSASPVFSATWDGGGADNLASTPANWAGDVLPPPGDSIIFDGKSSKDCMWDINETYSALAIDGGYTGAVTLNSTATLILGTYVPPSAPSATTNAVSNNIGTTAILNATVNPNGSETTVSFEWGTDTSYGNTTPTQIIPTGTTDVAVSADITGLTPNAPYHYRVKAVNSIGTTDGLDVPFTTPVIAPSATTNDVSNNDTGNSAMLNGSINPNGAETSIYFQWGTDTSYGNITTTQNIPTGNNNVAVTANISGLTVNTPFHYRVAATNSAGTTYGNDILFTTQPDANPFATTNSATNKNGTSATLNATVNPNGLQTSVYFEWGTTTSYDHTTLTQLLPAGADYISVAANITGLSINSTYHYRVVATNADGTTSGYDMMVTTPPIIITITSPADGSTIYRPDIMVMGNLVTTPGNETGVTVNGIVGMVYSNQFAVNHVPLTNGANTVSVTATDTAGNTATTAITVNAVTSSPYVRLTANPESGIAPLTVNFLASTSIPNAVTTYKIDFDGDGTIDYTGSTFTNISHSYSSPGIYYVTLTVVDTADISYTTTIAIVVLNSADLDGLLSAKWNAMKEKLLTNDIEGSLGYFINSIRDTYREMFNQFGFNKISTILSKNTGFNLSISYGRVAECGAIKTEDDGTEYSYPVRFVLDENGVWKIMGF